MKELQKAATGRYQIGSAPLAKAHVLRSELRTMARRGEIASAWGWVERNGMVYVKVERLRDPRSRVPWYVVGGSAAVSTVLGIGVMLWHTRYAWLALAGVVLLVVAGNRARGHRSVCVGLHCSGCK